MERIVYGDCWKLLQRFSSAVAATAGQDAKFELFCEMWHTLRMQHIYSAQTNHIEVIETTMAALHVAKRVACGRRTNGDAFAATRAERIGAIYLLYAIYNKQPTMRFIKIEVSPSTWQCLTGYVEQLRRVEAERRDTQQVSYVFWRLVQDQAFRYTALDYCQALDALAAYDSLESFAESKKTKNKTALLKHQLTQSEANIREELHSLAQLAHAAQSACQLETEYNKQMEPHRASFPATNIFSQLCDAFVELNDLLADKEKPTTSSVCSSDQQNVRKRIRQKAMWNNSEETQPTVDAEQEEEEEKSSTDLYDRRMSAATVFKRKLPEDVIRDLEC
ncbi:snRNA-activating protein complex subunit 1 [Drosophila grimshawi]|uniref:GH14314 n=1 Tax=Drosophila grimshawi TaxID=7222 RepID=B4JT43_DROGR|nr:snRNA-activating protein complex subunit 1 [Drosophila grimshawi]EDV94933.1 GH14314 [Drosophila grimshawi]